MFNSLRTHAHSKLVVDVTYDYNIFIRHDGNRVINQANLSRLIKSMNKKTLINPIIVNENMQVIDGEHRLLALQHLNQPIYYIVLEGYGLSEMQILNSVGKNWTNDDFMDSYIDLGYEDYKIYKAFKLRYGWGHNESLALLSCDNNRSQSQTFKNGDFKIANYNLAVDAAEKIEIVKQFYAGYRRRNFLYAMQRLFKNENYNHSVFLSKLLYQSTSLVDCVTVDAYILLIEEIYNYRNKNKVSLRY